MSSTPGSPGVEGHVLDRVRALLAKAESTTFPDEADAFTAKAQQLMARHAIDAALLDADGPGPGSGPVTSRAVVIEAPYQSAKSSLLGGVASVNRCRVVWSPDDGRAHVFGHGADLEIVEILFTSLLVQATTAMLAEGAQRDHRGRSRTRSFRHAFILAFATRVTERLRAATEAVVDGAEARTLVPVLAHRADMVDRAVTDAFPGATRRRASVTNAEGLAAGRTAAERAELHLHRAARADGRRRLR